KWPGIAIRDQPRFQEPVYRQLLVPLDGSSFAEQALPLALSIARRAEASLKLVHVHSPLAAVYSDSPVISDRSLENQFKRHKQDYLDRMVRRVGEISPIPVSSILMEGDVADTISRVASSTGMDLILMTTHARGIPGRLWLGSVADQLVHQSPVPLLLIPPQAASPGLEKDCVLKHFLVPLDGSALAEEILKPATTLGKLMDADYTLLRVIRPVDSFWHPTQGDPLGQEIRLLTDRMNSMQQSLREEARSYLDRIAGKLQSDSLRVKTMLTEEHQPGVAIIHTAVPQSFDCIAIETHGRRG